jgi:hypothetical protein
MERRKCKSQPIRLDSRMMRKGFGLRLTELSARSTEEPPSKPFDTCDPHLHAPNRDLDRISLQHVNSLVFHHHPDLVLMIAVEIMISQNRDRRNGDLFQIPQKALNLYQRARLREVARKQEKIRVIREP